MPVSPELAQSKILIVDDQPANISMLQQILSSEGYQHLRAAVDPRDALAIYEDFRPDLVLLDLKMPHLDGFQVMQQLQAADPDMGPSIIVLTASTEREMRLKALQSGAKDFLIKPFDVIEALSRIKNLLEGRLFYKKIVEQNQLLDRKINDRTKELLEEISQRRVAEEHIRYQANHDSLTDCPNRLPLEQKIQALLDGYAAEPQPHCALILLNLNRFGEVTNTVGFKNGDQLIQKIVERLVGFVNERPESLVIEDDIRGAKRLAVLNATTFGLLARADQAEALSQSLLAEMKRPFHLLGMSIEVFSLVGIAHFPGDIRDDALSVIRRAYVALDAAQRKHQAFLLYSDDINPYSPRRLSLISELRLAIEAKTLQLYYQPQFDIHTREVSALEALLRWHHPEHGFIPPQEFIPLAEQTGVIKPLTHWVLQTGIQQKAEFDRLGYRAALAVNVSVRNLMEEDFGERLTRMLIEYNVSPKEIILEITESAMMEENPNTVPTLQKLHDLGIRIAIDDFGTGYSSLSYLKRLPVNEIKIDSTFVVDMLRDKEDSVIVNATLNMSHNLGMDVVAEGVEDRETWQVLASMGCDKLQGFHLTPALPADELLNWFSVRHGRKQSQS